MNEDLAFGYLACAAGAPIDPLPLLELGDSPSSLGSIIRQGRQWFWSYPQYPRFHALAARAGYGNRRSRAFLTAQGSASRSRSWLGQSPAIATTLLLPVVARRRRLAAVATTAALTTYYAVPAAALANYLRRTYAGASRFGIRELAGGLAASLVSSIGPWWCLGNTIRQRITGTRYHHDKTER